MKTKYFESKPGVLTCSLTGAEYPYSVSDKASRLAAVDRLAARQATELQRMREKQPGLTDAQRFNPQLIQHPDPRSDAERRAAAQQRQQPSGVSDPAAPFAEQRIAALIKRHGRHFLRTDEGKNRVAEIYRQDKERAANAETARAQAEFTASIEPLTAHAQKNLDAVRSDPSTTQLEVEQAEARLKLAQAGDVAGYSAADRQWRQTQSDKIIAQTVEVDSQLNQLRQHRAALLNSAYQPVNESAEPQLVPVSYPDFYHDSAKAGKTIMEPMPQ